MSKWARRAASVEQDDARRARRRIVSLALSGELLLVNLIVGDELLRRLAQEHLVAKLQLTRLQVWGWMARKHLSRKEKSITGLFRIRRKSWRKGSLPMRMTASRKGSPSVCCTMSARRMFSEV
jgi:hypothetical protein